MVIRIAMRWNQEPNWFYTLEPSTKVKVLAEYRLYCETPEKKHARQEAIKRARMEAMIKKRMEHNES
jgi:hypothetical protein